ncbi:MAG: DNA (cytosine-5-)-methyltransferase [Bacteroidetes bacterium]|nr:DNA (cytosine-5-)-methyltransferase [Bacteroidota bacterium]
MTNNTLNFIDLFAGAGGLSEGFVMAGFNPIAHIEMDKAACYTLQTRVAYHYLKENGKIDKYIAYLKGDITRKQLYNLIPQQLLDTVIEHTISKANNQGIFRRLDKLLNKKKVDLIIGGPPCQAYSLVGRARSINNMKSDHRNYLFMEYARFLKRYDPKVFVFENVMGLRSADGGKYLRRMFLTFKNILGYEVKDFAVTAKDYDVLQDRKRIIIIGHKKGLNIKTPAPSIHQNHIVEHVLYDLPKIQAGEGIDKYLHYSADTNDYLARTGIRDEVKILTQHVSRSSSEQDKKIYRIAVEKWNKNKERLNYNNLPEQLQTHSNRTSFFDRFKIVAKELPYSQTIVAHIAKDGHYYIHPDISQNRSLSVREAARLQSFPDNYYFEGENEGRNRTAAYRQIGNAVPPLLAYRIAEEIKAAMLTSKNGV